MLGMGKIETTLNHKVLQKISIRLIFGILFVLGLIGVFAKFADSLLENELGDFDGVLSDLVHGLQVPWLTEVMITVTHIGNTSTYLVVVPIFLAILLFKKLKAESFILLTTILGAWGLNGALKFSFQRARPDIEHLIEVGGYSFPSGHAMVSMAAYGIMGYLIIQYMTRKGRSTWYVGVLVGLLIFLIGISRVYLHVHYPSDILAGFAAGAVWLIMNIYALNLLQRRGKRTKRVMERNESI